MLPLCDSLALGDVLGDLVGVGVPVEEADVEGVAV